MKSRKDEFRIVGIFGSRCNQDFEALNVLAHNSFDIEVHCSFNLFA
jgi:hypothetical protein